MNRQPVIIYDCDKAPEGVHGWITSITDRGEIWLLWENENGTKSRAKVTTNTASLFVGDRLLTPEDIARFWDAGLKT